MLTVVVPKTRLFNPDNNTFHPIEEVKLSMEHSLLSVKKWESRWKVPFLSTRDKTREQMLDYVKCMTLTKNVDPMVYQAIPQKEMDRIAAYIKDPMCATTIGKPNLIGAQKRSNEMVTAETIYYWMIALNIPVEFQKWHLEQLLMLIKLVNIKNNPKKKKLSQKELIARNAEINKANKAKLGIKD